MSAETFGIQDDTGQWFTPDSENLWNAVWSWQPTPVYPFNTRALAIASLDLAREVLFNTYQTGSVRVVGSQDHEKVAEA